MPIYMKYDGIDGAVTDGGHEKWIELDSFRWGASQSGRTGTGGGGGAGKVSFQDLHCVASVSSASPQIMEAVCSGKVFPKVEIDVVARLGDKQSSFLKYEMHDVLISSYSLGAQADDRPIDQVSLNFTSAIMAVGDAGGTIGFCDGSVRPKR